MRIAQIAPLQLSVPPKSYGGTERCIANLTEALVQLGHDVTLFATGDSATSARLVAGLPKPINFDPGVDLAAHHVAYLTDIYRQADQFDVIHSHLDYLSLPFAMASTTPTVVTLHGRIDLPEFKRVYRTYRDANYVSISKSQRSFLPELNWVATVHHAIDTRQFQFYPKQGDYLAFVGRISPEKCPESAVRIAKLAGMKLKVAAKVDSNDRPFFDKVFRPLLDEPHVEWLGEVDEETKREVMGNALATLMPINWPEPFGMVFIESLAVGTPVLTRPRGSVPELLRDGVTGFIRETDEELAEAVGHMREISRYGCREYVERKFDIRRMALKYVNAYSAVQQRKRPFQLVPESADELFLS